MKWRDLSYRHKVPLSLTLVILATAGIVSAVLLGHAWRDARDQFVQNASAMGRVLAQGLTGPLLHDDLWAAYETVRAPIDGNQDGQRFIVLDPRNRVYVSSDPRAIRPLTDAARLPFLRAALAADGQAAPVRDDGDWLYLQLPIQAGDGTRLGRLILAYHKDLVLPRFHATVRRVLIATAAALLVLLPLGWYAGNALAVPLIRLAGCFQRIGQQPLRQEDCPLSTGQDEIGLLGRRFREMLGELEEKQRLQKQMVATQRLAAIGRLTAGIAHEVNNPLGGMLNAINTYKRHGSEDPIAQRTIALIERGLIQVRETVGALLVEAKLENHALTAADLEDIRTLVGPELSQRRRHLRWTCAVPDTLPLPSTPVRQILLNLLLNATHAADGYVACDIAADATAVTVRVENDGPPIPAARMDHLFEPFAEDEGEGRGLGLWIIYQLVQQLNGSIDCESAAGRTLFTVRLPLETR
ncbi:sensor histidine kinase [Thiobacter aerophilum]|uniref:histidine kinase n=1 Tax=Thiobacter aerophilum TaxID=3121275 RepID=A0ABV0EE83_9BURK